MSTIKAPTMISPTHLRVGDQVLFNNKWRTVVGAYLLEGASRGFAVNYDCGKGETQTFFCGRDHKVDVRFAKVAGKRCFTQVTIKHGAQEDTGRFVVESTDGQRATFGDLKWAAMTFKALTGTTHNGDLPSHGILAV